MRRRCRYDVIADILRSLRANLSGLRITELCRLANLPVDRGLDLIEFLESKGLIYEEPINSGKIFRISDVGYTYLSLYESLTSLIN